MNTTRKGLLVLTSLLMLSACDLRLNEHVMKAREGNDLRQANRVDLVKFNHKVQFSGGQDLPSDAEYDRFDRFISSLNLGYGDEVVLVGSAVQPMFDERRRKHQIIRRLHRGSRQGTAGRNLPRRRII